MTDKIEIDVFDSVEQISPENWDAVAGESVGLNHTMLLCRERNFRESGKPRYFCARTSEEVMAISVAVIDDDPGGGSLTSRLFGRIAPKIRPVGRALDRALICGRIPGPGAAVVTRRDSDEPHWVRVICGAMEDYAHSHNLTMAYTSVQPGQSVLLCELRSRHYLRGIDLPIAILDVTWQDTQSYLKKLRVRRKKYAATARTEIRRFHASGARISIFSGTDYTELYALFRRHNIRKNASEFHYRPGILEDVVTQLGDDCIVYVAHKDAKLIGGLVIIRRNHNAWAWLIGIDHQADADSFCYFNMCFYHPCSQLPGLGVRQVYYGNAVQYAKYRRGCDIMEAQFFVKAKSGIFTFLLQPIFAMQRAFFTRKFGAVIRQGSNADE